MTGKDPAIAFLRQVTSERVAAPPRYFLSIKESVLMGRDPHCHIVLDPLQHRSVSRRHAEIRPILGFESSDSFQFWQVCDLSSANGTFLNGQRLHGCQVLEAGDHITLGQNGPEFIFEYDPAAERSAANPAPAANREPIGTTLPPAPAKLPLKPVDAISLTQLFPIFSTGRQLTQKAYLLPGMITVAFVVLLFLAVGNSLLFNMLLAAYISGTAYYFIYQLCGKRKPWWLLTSVAAMTMLLLVSPVLDLSIFVFRTVLPGGIPEDEATVSFPILLLRMFFGAGLMEELLKALPILGICLLGASLRSPWRERLGVWEPLDGILLGAASAVGFTLLETLGQYVPEIYKATLQAGEGAAQLASLQLLIPRVLGSVAGHMAYSGYLGYFIGLSMLRSRQRWLILGVGYLTAAGLHALWNATGALSPVVLAVVGVISYAFLGAAILKARELSPTRSQNFATRLYR